MWRAFSVEHCPLVATHDYWQPDRRPERPEDPGRSRRLTVRVVAPAIDAAVGPNATGMIRTAGQPAAAGADLDEGAGLAGCLAGCLAGVVPPPAGDVAIGLQATAMLPAGADLDERPGLILRLAVAVQTPTVDAAIGL